LRNGGVRRIDPSARLVGLRARYASLSDTGIPRTRRWQVLTVLGPGHNSPAICDARAVTFHLQRSVRWHTQAVLPVLSRGKTVRARNEPRAKETPVVE